ncbi:MAG: HD domain-containing protein, partial [Oscillospiraceae bacterium]
MLESFEKLVSEMEESAKGYDIKKIRRAFDVAEEAHQGQKRVSGEDYIIHPVCVAHILFEMGMDTDSMTASMLHDVVEDTEIELSFVEKNFGDDVALLVDGVTKLGKIKYTSKEQQQAENIRKMLLAMSQDVRVVIIKLADRLHNMRTLDVMRPQKRRDKALETMEVYAPIAHRLG